MINKVSSISQIDVSFLCICPLIDDKFYHNIVKMAVEPKAIDKWFCSKLDNVNTYGMQYFSSIIRGQTHTKLMSICFLQKTSPQNGQIYAGNI